MNAPEFRQVCQHTGEIANLRAERDNVLPFLIAEKKQSANLAHELQLALHELERVRDERDQLLVVNDELKEEIADLAGRPWQRGTA